MNSHLTGVVPCWVKMLITSSQKVEVGLLLPADLHPQPPGVDGSHTETPGRDAKQPLANPVGYPKIERI
jgi:hypothetical protein